MDITNVSLLSLCCYLAAMLIFFVSSGTTGLLSCYSCLYYSNIGVPTNNKACISGEAIGTDPCSPENACKVTFLQDSIGSIVHASRGCQQSGSFRSSSDRAASVVLNARTTMYCRQYGCNNNWKATASPQPDDGRQQLHCWVGYGRHIDQFKLMPCSQKILRLTQRGNRSTGGQSPVCLLAQLTRQIRYNGSVFESAAYMADCAPHATSVYGQNYPMFEYERVCQEPGCNSGAAAERLDVGLLTTLGAGGLASTAGAAAALSPLLTVVLAAAAVAPIL